MQEARKGPTREQRVGIGTGFSSKTHLCSLAAGAETLPAVSLRNIRGGGGKPSACCGGGSLVADPLCLMELGHRTELPRPGPLGLSTISSAVSSSCALPYDALLPWTHTDTHTTDTCACIRHTHVHACTWAHTTCTWTLTHHRHAHTVQTHTCTRHNHTCAHTTHTTTHMHTTHIHTCAHTFIHVHTHFLAKLQTLVQTPALSSLPWLLWGLSARSMTSWLTLSHEKHIFLYLSICTPIFLTRV